MDTVGPNEQADQTTEATKNTKPPTHDDPQIPQRDLRFVRERGKQKQKPNQTQTNGAGAQKQHPQDQSAKGHSGLTTASLSNTWKMN